MFPRKRRSGESYFMNLRRFGNIPMRLRCNGQELQVHALAAVSTSEEAWVSQRPKTEYRAGRTFAFPVK
jgi:hypothetical protein